MIFKNKILIKKVRWRDEDKEKTKRRTAQENMLKDYPGDLKSGSCGSLKSGKGA